MLGKTAGSLFWMARYLERSRWRARSRACYIDKWPENYLAAGLLHTLAPERLKTMQRAARESARQYDLTERAAALEQVYAEVLAGKKRRR